jgi:hypothetical protein
MRLGIYPETLVWIKKTRDQAEFEIRFETLQPLEKSDLESVQTHWQLFEKWIKIRIQTEIGHRKISKRKSIENGVGANKSISILTNNYLLKVQGLFGIGGATKTEIWREISMPFEGIELGNDIKCDDKFSDKTFGQIIWLLLKLAIENNAASQKSCVQHQ